MTYRRSLASCLVLSTVGCALLACSAGSSSSEATGASSQALMCNIGDREVPCDPTPSPQPTPPPQAPTCTVFDAGFCSGTTKTTPGFSPLVDPVTEEDGGVLLYNDAFSDMLATYKCQPELDFGQGNGASFATAICPDVVSELIAEEGYSADGTAQAIQCNTCTGQPGVGQVVIQWQTGIGYGMPPCAPYEPGGKVPPCGSPGPGCNSLGCMEF